MRRTEDWQKNIPVDEGVNWAMPMEVAIRGYWLTMGFGLFHGAPNISSQWWANYLKLVYAHGEHLINNLEYFPNLTNHYISNCFGLIVLGSIFYEETQGKHWFGGGYKRLLTEIENQVLEDGVHYELSVCYHRLVLEMFLISSMLCKQAGKLFPEWAMNKIEKMSEFLNDYVHCSDIAPQFGDSDDGIILRTTNDQNIYDHSDTLALAGVIFKREDFILNCKKISLSAMIITGTEGYEFFRSVKKKITNSNTTNKNSIKVYKNGGFIILQNENYKVIIDLGVIGLHGNNDSLSFALYTKNDAIIVDTGTYRYTSEPTLRNALRSSLSHNAITVDNKEIAEFDGLWRVKKEIKKPIFKILNDDVNNMEVEAEHFAYNNLGVKYKRSFCLSKNSLVVIDKVYTKEKHKVSLKFMFDKNCNASLDRAYKDIVNIHTSIGKLNFESSEKFVVTDSWYSPSYGVAVSTKVIEINNTIENDVQMKYIFKML
ncbi:MAG: alginate lyase family protein [Chlorobiota bacterium]|nr:alginate lyase family protein [Chlorobiota bacterium]QQS67244.1 MAG: alginate lyase family protein [Chlorobiota bacterium]